MSPLAILLMRILRSALWVAAGLIAVFIGLDVWQVWFSGQYPTVPRGEYVFAGILLAMFIGAVWMALSISRELRDNPRRE